MNKIIRKFKKKAVVTGGAGFIGSNLVDVLLSNGYEVVVYDNLTTGKREFIDGKKGVKLKLIDIRDHKSVDEAASSDFIGVDTVFHLAALPRVEPSIIDPVHFHDTNVNGTLNILWACKKYNVKKVVCSSSSSVYGNAEKLPINENSPINPMSPYALQKSIGDQYSKMFCDLYDMNISCLRYFNVYGNHEPTVGAYVPVVGIWFRQFSEEKPLTITGDGTQSRDFVNVLDVANANLLCSQAELKGYNEFNVGSGKQYELNYLAKLISDDIKYIPSRIEPKHTLSDVSKLEKMTGWNCKYSIENYIFSKIKTLTK